jgi:peptide chain release factor 1
MFKKLDSLEKRYNEIVSNLSDEKILKDFTKYKELSKELSRIEPIIKKYKEYKKILKTIEEDKLLLKNEDNDLKELAEEELKELEERKTIAIEELKKLIISDDPNDQKNIILEIRAGTGGEEAALFASELFRMYTRYAERKKWKTEILNANYSDLKGIKEIVVSIRGEKVYTRLKYESGVHRVQRVPQTETSGRIHTSTATVAVLPEAEEIDVKLDPKELRIDAFSASGPGGQNVNRNYTAIRITHLPTNIVVSIQDEKSQHKNKEKALRILRTRLYEIEQEKKNRELSQQRKSQVGTGERSEKIRTYNYPQNRVTDHRIGVNIHNLTEFLNGDMDYMIDQLITYFQAKKLEEELSFN